jgi:hypothetical protein
MYSVLVAGGCLSVHETPNPYAARRIAKRIIKQGGIWVKKVPGYLTTSYRKFKGAKFVKIWDAETRKGV